MPHNAHDALFRSTFSNPKHAIGELRHVLPPKLFARLDLASLKRCPGSFVDEKLRDQHTDLLFSVRLNRRRAFIYVLLEHMSGVDPLLPFRLLCYMVQIWRDYLAKHPRAKRLPIIIPVVVHHSESGWTKATGLEELFALDKETLALVEELLPRFRFLLDDISHESDEALQKRAMSALGQLSLWCLKHSRDPEQVTADLERWAEVVLRVLTAPNGRAAFGAILRYIYETDERISVDNLKALMDKVAGKKGREAVMTLAERLRQEGQAEGRKEGQQELLLGQLQARFGALPKAAVARVKAADQAELQRLAKRVLSAATLDEVLRKSPSKPTKAR